MTFLLGNTFCLMLSLGLVQGLVHLDPVLITKALEDVATKALGVNYMQEYLDDSVDFTTSEIDGQDIVKKLSKSLEEKFLGRYQLVWDLKNTVEASLDEFTTSSSIGECCRESIAAEYNPRFQKHVHIDKTCSRTSSYADKDATYPPQAVVQQFRDNLAKIPDIKWQYLGMETGKSFHFPAFKYDTCGKYDARFRPWYVETATPKPKDVIVILDTSGSMEGTLLRTAKEAGKSVISTLNFKDRVGVVSFSTYAEAAAPPTSQNAHGSEQCFKRELALGTAQNKDILHRYIDGLAARGQTYYDRALSKAYELFQNTPDDADYPNRERVILFLTDGDPTTTDNIFPVMEKKHKELFNNNITVMTYAIGDISEKGIGILSDMSKKSTNKPGTMSKIQDIKTLRKSMASYYKLFGDISSLTVSMPYFDASGLGLMTAVTLPVYDKTNKFIGVVGVDITLADLYADVDYFQHGVNSYAFVIDKVGEVLTHPLLPMPFDASGAPVYVKITDLEQDQGIDVVVDSMKRGQSGFQEMTSTRHMSRGDVKRDGIKTWEQPSVYHWMPIKDTEFSVAIVLAVDEEWPQMNVKLNREVPFTYHNLTLTQQLDRTKDTCTYLNRMSTKTDTVVKFGAKAFVSPYEYLDTEETVKGLERYSNVLRGLDDIPIFKKEALQAVTVSAQVHNVWFGDDMVSEEAEKYSIWRYIAFASGVVRKYPGAPYSKYYDPTARPWYQRSLAYKGQLVVSAPYKDISGAGFVVTLSKALFMSRVKGQAASTDSIVGVMGIDFSINFLYNTITTNYPQCKADDISCFLVDASGYVVIHKDFVTAYNEDVPKIQDIHITNKEPSIAVHLIKKQYMVKRSCVNVYNINENHYFEVVANKYIDHRQSKPSYEISPLKDTNLFLIVKKDENNKNNQRCECSKDNIAMKECTISFGSAVCHCPCFSSAKFQLCRNEFTVLHGANQDVQDTKASICTPSIVDRKTNRAFMSQDFGTAQLQQCFEPNCANTTSDNECYSQSQCNWCHIDSSGKALTQPFCGLLQECMFGRVDFTESTALGTGAIVTIAIVAVAIIIIAAIAIKKFVLGKKEVPTHRADVQESEGMMQRPQTSSPSDVSVSFSKGGRIPSAPAPDDVEFGGGACQVPPYHAEPPPAYTAS